MEHYFDLPVEHKGEHLIFKGRLVTFAYTCKFYIVFNGQELVFEKDDEGQYRVLTEHTLQLNVERDLLDAIVFSLKNL